MSWYNNAIHINEYIDNGLIKSIVQLNALAAFFGGVAAAHLASSLVLSAQERIALSLFLLPADLLSLSLSLSLLCGTTTTTSLQAAKHQEGIALSCLFIRTTKQTTQ